MIKFIVYACWDLDRDQPVYIGKTHEGSNRFERHVWCALSEKPKLFFHTKLKRMIERGENYEFRILYETFDQQAVNDEEKRYIALYGRRDLSAGPLTNLTDGGEGMQGWKMSAETSAKLSALRKGKPSSQKGIKKGPHTVPSPKKGKPWTEKQRAAYDNQTAEQREQRRKKSSDSHKGQQQSDEWRKQHSSRMTGSGNPNYGKVGYYAGKIGPWAGKSHPNKGRKKGPDGKLYHPDELFKKFGI